jgi:hypothetical protein
MNAPVNALCRLRRRIGRPARALRGGRPGCSGNPAELASPSGGQGVAAGLFDPGVPIELSNALLVTITQ